MRIKNFLILFIFLLLTACESHHTHLAPVMDVTRYEHMPKNGIYIVKKDDTIYSIAWGFGMDYRTLAKRNHLNSSYKVLVGEKIYLQKSAPTMVTTKNIVPAQKIQPHPIQPVEEVFTMPRYWRWPARGVVSGTFLNKGINIVGTTGEPIVAAASGKVVYCGNGLKAYGNLIIIKHNNTYLSAYAYNRRVFVKEGEWVRMGQKIAEMGRAGQDRYMLHFEIRKNGLSVNPLIYLRK